MRFSFVILLILSIAYAGCGQQSNASISPEMSQKGTVSIQVKEPNVQYNLVQNQLFGGQKPIELTDGAAEIEVDGKQEIGFFLQTASVTFYALPGDDIIIEVKESKPVIQTGRAAYDSYLAAKVDILSESMNDIQSRMKLDATEFLERENFFHNKLLENLDQFSDEMQEGMVATERASIYMQKATFLVQYPNYYSYLNGGASPSDDLRGELERIISLEEAKDLQNPSFIDMHSQLAMSKEAEKLMSQGVQITADNYVDFQLNSVQNNIEDQEIRDVAIAKMVVSTIEFDMEAAKDFYDAQVATIPDAYRVRIDNIFDEWRTLMPGKPAPDFSTVDMQGNEVKLSDLRGKFVYIDVWATWCGPCIQEIPHLKELDEEYKDDEIVFLSVSIDDTKMPWQEMVEEKELKGLQVYIDGAWSSTLVNDYKIAGIPRFMLVDPDGNIVTVQAARPSGNIRETIDELLSKS